jgi:hypothetical protein
LDKLKIKMSNKQSLKSFINYLMTKPEGSKVNTKSISDVVFIIAAPFFGFFLFQKFRSEEKKEQFANFSTKESSIKNFMNSLKEKLNPKIEKLRTTISGPKKEETQESYSGENLKHSIFNKLKKLKKEE